MTLPVEKTCKIYIALLSLQELQQFLAITFVASQNEPEDALLSTLLALSVTEVVPGTFLGDAASALLGVLAMVTGCVLACRH